MVTIGIDIGGSATKIIGFIEGRIKTEPVMIRASDPTTSLFGAFGKFITVNNLKIQDISNVVVTGLGAQYVTEAIYGINTARAEEFLCIGLGGLHLSKLTKALVVSMGTGTAFVRAENDEIEHMGGSGVGGGTLTGLALRMFNVRDIDYLLELSKKGSLANVDLAIKDITSKKMTLGENVTVSNFGKMSDSATNPDVALGLLNMTFQTIGVMACFLANVTKDKKVVLTGNLSTFDITREICEVIGELHSVDFIVPEHSEFATAAGAALALIKNKEYEIIP